MAIGLILLGALIFAPAVSGYLLADDFTWIHDFHRFDWRNTGRVFAGSGSWSPWQEYRPLWALSFAVDLAIWGLNPIALHLVSIGFHLAASTLVWRLATGYGGSRSIAGLLGLAFFILAPTHEQAVGWISERGHVLVTIFILAAILLLRGFQVRGSLAHYVGSIIAAAGAFATQELSVALPALLLLRDILDPPGPREKPHRLILIHSPFWILLGGYLALRLMLFGKILREDAPPPLFDSLAALYLSVKAMWLSPTMLADHLPRWSGLALLGATALLISAPALFRGQPGAGMGNRFAYLWAIVYYGVLWPVVTTAPLMGATDQRHFYLASVGSSIALGLAAGRALAAPRSVATMLTTCLAGLLLLSHGLLLASGVRAFARNGQVSRQLADQLDNAILGAEVEPNAVVVVIWS